MLDAALLTNVNTYLSLLKGNTDLPFGGINIIFAGDFLQLPTVSCQDVYMDNKSFHAHTLSRSQNAVITLTKQVHQSSDPYFGAILARLRLRQPTDEDIDALLRRVGAHIDKPDDTLVVMHRHKLRHAINRKQLETNSHRNNSPIIIC